MKLTQIQKDSLKKSLEDKLSSKEVYSYRTLNGKEKVLRLHNPNNSLKMFIKEIRGVNNGYKFLENFRRLSLIWLDNKTGKTGIIQFTESLSDHNTYFAEETISSTKKNNLEL